MSAPGFDPGVPSPAPDRSLGSPASDPASRYREHRPSRELLPLIECYWTFRGTTPRGTALRRVLPDGCSDILFDLGDSAGVEGETRPERFVVGTMTRAVRVEHTGTVDLVGVRFRPGGALPFTGVPASEIVDDHVDLDAAWGVSAREAWERVGEAAGTRARLAILEGVLLSRLRETHRPADPLVLRAAALIAGGSPPRFPAVEAVAERLGVSRRHLERRFAHHVGLAPGQLRRVARLRLAADLIASGARPQRAADRGTLGAVAVRAGYHDQAHLNRDFRSLVGVTPGVYRRELTLTSSGGDLS